MVDDTTRYRRLIERFMNGGMSRRRFLGSFGRAAMAYGVVGSVATMLSREAQAAGVLAFEGTGGTINTAFDTYGLKPFSARTGTKVEMGTTPTTDLFLSKLQAAGPGQYNIFFSESEFGYKQISDLGYETALDESRLPNLANLIPALLTRFRALGKGKLSSIPFVYTVGTMSFDSAHVDPAYVDQVGANALTDKKFKDKIAADLNWMRRIWYGALQTGQDPNNIHDMGPVWDKVRESKAVILKYYTTSAEQISLLANEEVWIEDTWAARAAEIKRLRPSVHNIVAKGSRAYIPNLYVLKDSPMDAALELLNTLLQPEVAIQIAQAMPYPSALDPTKFKMPEALTGLPGYDPTGKLDNLTFQDPTYWSANATDWKRQFDRIALR